MAYNIFVYWSDGLGCRAFNRRSGNGAGHLATKVARRAGCLTKFFQCPGFAWGMLAAGINSHIRFAIVLLQSRASSDVPQ